MHKKESYLFEYKIIYILIITSIFFSVSQLALDLNDVFIVNGYWVLSVEFIVLFWVFGKLYGAFSINQYRVSELVFANVISVLLSGVFLFMTLIFNQAYTFQWMNMVAVLVVMLISTVTLSVFSNRIYVHYFTKTPSLVIYDFESIDSLKYKFRDRKHVLNLENAEFIHILKPLHMIEERMATYTSILLSTQNIIKRNELMQLGFKHNKDVFVVPVIQDVLLKNMTRINLYESSLWHMDGQHTMSVSERFLKRLIDVMGSIIALIMFSPLLVFLFVVVKFDDGGPFIYTQERLTQGGKSFKVYKIRSMNTDAEWDGVARLAQKNDNRITRVGKYIRRYRVDEVPQFLNVLFGDMSLVGPRPERPDIYTAVEEDLPYFKERLKIKAGLTGYAQVYGRYNTSLKDKILMDIEYINNRSFLLDLKIILITIKILFLRESSEGVS
jgi:exopolysaccharide biosynthesis polyprenyl glycosylphosphotransferase